MTDRRTTSRLHRDGGFTLPELLLVIAIMGIISTAIFSGISVVLRNQDSTLGRLSQQRNIQGLTTWLPADVASTPPNGLVIGGGGCGSGGQAVLGLTWTETVDGTTTTYRVTYRTEEIDGSTRLWRHACSGGGPTAVLVSNELPPMGGWSPSSPPIQLSYDETARVLTMTITQKDGQVVSLRAAQYNPAQELEDPPGTVMPPPPPPTPPSTTTTTTLAPPETTTTTTVVGETTTTVEGETTLPPETTTTVPATTTTTEPPCAVTGITVSPDPVAKKSNDQLRDGATVTVTTTGPCSSLRLRYTPGNPALVTRTLSGGPTVWTATLPRNSERWYGVGPQELRVIRGAETLFWSHNAFSIVAS
jgi:prepilin-type N-terminal cleavage/methylation domain-containing protein